MARSYFKIYFSSRRVLLEMLDDAQRGRVLAAAFNYAEKGTPPDDLDTGETFVFENLRIWIDDGKAQYDRKCKANQENGARGGRPKNAAEKPTGFSFKDKDKDKDKAKDKDKDNGNRDTRARARENAPDGALPPPPPTAPEDLWLELGFGSSRAYAGKCFAGFRSAGCTDGLIRRALEIAADNGACRWAYARAILQHAAAAGTLTAEAFEATRRRPGSGRNTPVTRQAPGADTGDFLRNAAARPRRLKRRDTADAPAAAADPAQGASEASGQGNNTPEPETALQGENQAAADGRAE